jgi:hypothetical protein
MRTKINQARLKLGVTIGRLSSRVVTKKKKRRIEKTEPEAVLSQPNGIGSEICCRRDRPERRSHCLKIGQRDDHDFQQSLDWNVRLDPDSSGTMRKL